MKASDLSDERIIGVLMQHPGKWHSSLGPNEWMPHVYDPAFPDVPREILIEKLRSMIERELISGCACGCRGDFFVGDEDMISWDDDE